MRSRKVCGRDRGKSLPPDEPSVNLTCDHARLRGPMCQTALTRRVTLSWCPLLLAGSGMAAICIAIDLIESMVMMDDDA